MVEEKYLTLQQTSKFLKISISTLNRLIRQNRIPSYKVGHRRLFDKDELVQWVRTQSTEFQVDGCGMKEVIPEPEGQTVESIIHNCQSLLCMLTGEHELSNGNTCQECQWRRSCQQLIHGL